MTNNRILFITEYFAPPYDEGIKKTAYNIYRLLSERYNVKVICRDYQDADSVTMINCNSIFFSLALFKLMRSYEPQGVIYLPFASFTLGGYLRNAILGLMSLGASYTYIGLQPKSARTSVVRLLTFLNRGVGLTPSMKLFDTWKRLGRSTRLIPLYTDLSRFKPRESTAGKEILRSKYGIPNDSYVISHVGHLSRGRNLESLLQLQQAGNHVLIISSTSTPNESKAPDALKNKLLDHGIIIYEEFIEDIAEVYCVSDLYVFPVLDDCSSIGLPLSILEARACGIPVLTTDYGSVKHFLGDDNGCVYYSSPDAFVENVEMIKSQVKSSVATNVTDLNRALSHELFHAISRGAL